jgi:hypothetical protein
MRAYGTDVNFKEKTSHVSPIAERIGELAVGRAMLANLEHGQHRRQTAQAEILNTAFRMIELARMEQAIDNAGGHKGVPMILSAGMAAELPAGMTEGMVRMASVIGANMAKESAADPTMVMSPEEHAIAAGGHPYRTPAPKPTVAAPAAAPAAAAGAAEAGPGLSEGAKKLWDRTGLSNGRYKYKLPILATGAVATLGAMYGAKKVFNWLGSESAPPSYANSAPQVAPGNNEYGYAQPRLPHY